MLRYKVRLGDVIGVKVAIKNGADISQPGKTMRQWTGLHIACWGSSKPANDLEVIETILLAAMKQGKSKEEEVRSVKDKEGLTPADVAKQKRDKLPPVTNAEEGGAAQEERRKFDKIVEWLEKGLPRN